MVAELINGTVQGWTVAPDKAKARPIVNARSDGKQAVLESGSFSWRADMPLALGGSNQAASPTELLLSALAGCAVVFIKDTLAPQLSVQVDAVRATATCSSDARGLIGMDGAAPGLQDISLAVQIESPAGQAAIERVMGVWQERCPVYLALEQPTPVRVSTRVIDPYAAP
jgi:uncharacterized OsmC-like protein